MKLLNNMVRAVARLFTGDPPELLAPETLDKMELAASDLNVDAFADGANELLHDSVRLVHDAKLSEMTRGRRREVESMGDDELASWLYGMCMDVIPDMPPLKARMLLAVACARYAEQR